MVDIFSFQFWGRIIEREILFAAIIGATFRESVGCDRITSQRLSRSLRSRRMFAVVRD